MDLVSLVLYAGIFLLLTYVVVNLIAADAKPLYGLYAVPGRWFSVKYYFIKVVLLLARRRTWHVGLRARDRFSMLKTFRDLAEIDCSTGIEENNHSHNSFYVNGSDPTGSTRLIVRVAIRPGDERDIWFLLRLAGLGDLVLPQHPHCVVSNVPGSGFSGGGLQCSVTNALKVWRISYNGLCRVGIRNKWEEVDTRPQVHLRCSFIWSTFTTYFSFSTDVNPCLVAQSVAKEMWTRKFFQRLNKKSPEQRFQQFGVIHGTVQVDDRTEREVVMRGVRERSCGFKRWRDVHSYMFNYIVLEDGNCLYVEACCFPDSLSSWTSGYVMRAIGGVIPLMSVDLSLADLIEKTEDPPMNFSFSVQPETSDKLFIEVDIRDIATFNMDSDWSVRIREGLSRFKVNGVQGWGVCQILKRYDGGCPVKQLAPTLRLYREQERVSDSEARAWVVSLREPSCQSSSLTGGKGSQLAKLTSLQKDNQNELRFEVPPGFVITTVAFRRHLEDNLPLRVAVKELTDVSCALIPGDLKESCERTVALFIETDISSDMKREIGHLYQELCNDPSKMKQFAVRSSAVGEDAKQTSAAGQMDTFLGVKSLEKIFIAMRKCWASQFSLQAVQYRRQYGQKVDSEMAVVVQEMVPAESSGVVFSRDPLTGNPARVVINANFGLGESVVAGVSDVDTITVYVDESNNVKILDKKIGGKEQAVYMSEDGGTVTTELKSDTRACSLLDDACVELGQIAVLLDKCFGDGVDIEWATVHDRIYLLQVRSITTLDAPTEYEVMHEFDSAHPSESSWMSTANLQEINPGCSTPLSMSALTDLLDYGVQMSAYCDYGLPVSFPAFKFGAFYCNQMLMNIVLLASCFLQVSQLKQDSFLHSVGVLVDDAFINEIQHLNAPVPSTFSKIRNLANMLKNTVSCRKRIETSVQDVMSYFTTRGTTAQEQYDDIINGRYNADLPGISHHYVTSVGKASVGEQILIGILSRYSNNAVSDFAILMSSGPDVVSAQAPFQMEEIARAIQKEGKSEAFQSMTSEQAVQWLKAPSSGQAGILFAAFLRNHGHRSLKESGLEAKSWDMDPTQLIPSLQASLKGSATSPRGKLVASVSDLIDQLQLPLPATVRWMLVWIFVPFARYVFAEREVCKSVYIKAICHFKLAFWRLAKLMVSEFKHAPTYMGDAYGIQLSVDWLVFLLHKTIRASGFVRRVDTGFIPDEELLFYLTLTEIGQLLKERAPSLVTRAHRRRRIEPDLAAIRLPKLMHGRPTPITEEVDESETSDMTLQGTPICQGTVRGNAVVVTDLKDGSKIKKGDILVTKTVDIGWSPYFPIIKGLVTEIGGVVSHGAIVAREFGIPCVVNIPKATRLFKSGDTVVVDGKRGTVEKQSEEPSTPSKFSHDSK